MTIDSFVDPAVVILEMTTDLIGLRIMFRLYAETKKDVISRHYFSIYPVLSRIMQGIYFSSSRRHDQESNTDNKHKRTNK